MFETLRGWIGGRRKPARAPAPPPPPALPDVDFKALADNSIDLIVRCGLDEIASYVSPSAIRLLGIEPAELVGRSHMSLVVPEDRHLLHEVVARHLAGQREAVATFRMMRKDGTRVWVEGSGRMVEDATTAAPEFVIVMRDVTERKALEEKLASLALTDALTGLGNRRAFDDAFETEWLRTKREGTMLSLLMIDVDCFKAFNDCYGHPTGDDCLRAVSAAVAKVIRRPGDLATRYGGEEIAIILPRTDMAGAVTIAENVRAAVLALGIPHAQTATGAGFVTVSVGCATALARLGASVTMPASLLQAADTALYKAKENGRNRLETALLLTATGAVRSADAA